MAKPASSIAKRADALWNWVDSRLPVSAFWNATMTGYQAPEELQFLVLHGFACPVGAGYPDSLRHFPDHALQAFRRVGFRIG